MESDQVGGLILYNCTTNLSEQCRHGSLRSVVSKIPSSSLSSSITSSIHNHYFQYHHPSPSLTLFVPPIYASVDPGHSTTYILEPIHSATQKRNEKCYPQVTVLVPHNQEMIRLKIKKGSFPTHIFSTAHFPRLHRTV